MRAIRLQKPSPNAGRIDADLADIAKPRADDSHCVIEVHGSGVNMSDAKGVLGLMHNCIWPRTPGRDYAGIVVDGPRHLIGQEVWGSGGDLGMSVDGAHAEYIKVRSQTVTQKPGNISMHEAAAIGVPFCTAYIGLVDYCGLQPGQCVIVFGANGNVGNAVIQTALMKKAQVIAVVRGKDAAGSLDKFTDQISILNAQDDTLAEAIKALTKDGEGGDIAFNTVGQPYFQAALDALGQRGQQVIINAVEPKEVTLNLFDFYRKQLRLVGMASMSSDSLALSKVLVKLKPLFESGDLEPFPVSGNQVFSLENAGQSYARVLKGDLRNRVVIDPRAQ